MPIATTTSSPLAAEPALEARYANYFEVGHNPFEFVLDFGQHHSENGVAHPHTRIVTAPVYAKTLATMLLESIQAYERQRGAIDPVDTDTDPIDVVRASIAGYDPLDPEGHSRKR
jgi:hypothetical protein